MTVSALFFVGQGRLASHMLCFSFPSWDPSHYPRDGPSVGLSGTVPALRRRQFVHPLRRYRLLWIDSLPNP